MRLGTKGEWKWVAKYLAIYVAIVIGIVALPQKVVDAIVLFLFLVFVVVGIICGEGKK